MKRVIIVVTVLVFIGFALKIPGEINKRRAENKASEIYSAITKNDDQEKSVDYCDTYEQGPFGGGNRWCGRYIVLSNVTVEQIKRALEDEGWTYISSKTHASNRYGGVVCDVYIDNSFIYMPDDVREELGLSYQTSPPVSYLFCLARS